MAFQRVITVALPSPLGRTCVKAIPRLDRQYPQSQLLCLKVRHPIRLRYYFTKSQSTMKAFTLRTKMKQGEEMGNFVKRQSGHWMCVRRIYDRPPSRVEPLVKNVLRYVSINWRWKVLFGGAVSSMAVYLHYIYWRALKKNPLTGRNQFLPLTDQEAYDLALHRAIKNLSTRGIVIETQRDDDGNATDRRTIRVERIMNILIEKNPELTHMLLPAATWRPIVVQSCEMIGWSGALSYQSGHLVVAGDILDLFPEPDEMAFMIAHEMAHVILQHDNEYNGRFQFFYHFFVPVLKKIKEVLPNADIRDYIKKFSKFIRKPPEFEHELDADKLGFQFAAKACYDFTLFGDALYVQDQYLREIHPGLQATAHHPELANDAQFSNDVIDALMEMDTIWYTPKHPDIEDRIHILQSMEFLRNGERWRAENDCFPVSLLDQYREQQQRAIAALSQKVDDFIAARKVKTMDRKVANTDRKVKTPDHVNSTDQVQPTAD